MKVKLTVGGQAVVLPYKEAICLNCAKCDLVVWKEKKWSDGSCPEACRGLGVCSPSLVACSEFEGRRKA